MARIVAPVVPTTRAILWLDVMRPKHGYGDPDDCDDEDDDMTFIELLFL